MKLSRWKVAGFVLLIWSLIALPVIGPSWIYPKLFPPDPIPDSVQRAESLWWDSSFRADSMLQDSIDRGLIRVIYRDPKPEEPDPRVLDRR
jgi:hypothetical protein